MEFAPNLDIIINETLPALQKVKDSGKAKFIGITGYPLDNFKWVNHLSLFSHSMFSPLLALTVHIKQIFYCYQYGFLS